MGRGSGGAVPLPGGKLAINYAKLGVLVIQTFRNGLHTNFILRELPVLNIYIDTHGILV